MKSLNQLFRPQAKYDQIKQQIAGGVFDDDRLIGFHVEGEYIIAPDNRAVVPPNELQQTFEWLYDERGIHFIASKGIKSLWNWIQREYINITRAEVKAFLSKKGLYQITRESIQDKGKVVVARKPNAFWGCDLVDMSAFG
ncbi:MAG: hypothetical protein EOP48_07705, partial [Sphingobacteriales bacterium]